MNKHPEHKLEEIKKNFEFFQKKLPELLEENRGRYALLRRAKIVNIYDTALDAQTTGEKLYADDMFSVQKIMDSPIDLGFFSHAVHLG